MYRYCTSILTYLHQNKSDRPLCPTCPTCPACPALITPAATCSNQPSFTSPVAFRGKECFHLSHIFNKFVQFFKKFFFSIGCSAATIGSATFAPCTQITTAPSGTFVVTTVNAESALLGIGVACPNTKVTVNCVITSNGNTVTANAVIPYLLLQF